jgi:CDP-glucose 4,6-dehydratase
MFKNQYYGKRVLITGNTGFKGSWLTMWLNHLGAVVYGISNDIPTSPSMFQELNLESKIEHYYLDIRNLEEVRAVITKVKPDYIFHLAAQAIVSTSYEDPVTTISTNVIGTMNVLETLRSYKHPCIAVIITSDKCYDNVEWVYGYKETDALGGKDIYSGSKGAAELVFKSYFHSYFKAVDSNIRLAVARAGNVIGGGDWAQDRIIPDSMRAWSGGATVEIRSPKATRPWQHVMEPLSGYLSLGAKLKIKKNLNGQSFNFGPSSEYNRTVCELLEDLSQSWDFTDVSDAYTVTDNRKFHEAGLLKLNCDKALFFLKWNSTLNYRQTVKSTGDWYYKYYNSPNGMYEYTLDQIKQYQEYACAKGVEWGE